MENEREYSGGRTEEPIHGMPREEVPEIVKEEPDDKPAGKTVQWTIVVAVIILAIVYFVFFYEK